MSSLASGFKKSPGLVVLALATLPLFVGGLFFAMMPVESSAWELDLSSALLTTRSGFALYFGIALPILIASASAVLMQPEFQRGNSRWMLSHPQGISYIMREKTYMLVILCAVIAAIHGGVIAIFGVVRGAWSAPEFTHILVGAVTSGVGIFAVSSLYVFVHTFTKTTAGTISLAIGLTVMSMVLAVFEAYTTGGTSVIETILPTSQIISTTAFRSGELGAAGLLTSLIISLVWAVVLLNLSKRRLQKR